MFSTCFPGFQDESFEVLAAPMLEFPVMIQSLVEILAQLWHLPVRSHGLDLLRVLDCWTPNDRSRSGSWGHAFYGAALTQEKYLVKTDF